MPEENHKPEAVIEKHQQVAALNVCQLVAPLQGQTTVVSFILRQNPQIYQYVAPLKQTGFVPHVSPAPVLKLTRLLFKPAEQSRFLDALDIEAYLDIKHIYLTRCWMIKDHLL